MIGRSLRGEPATEKEGEGEVKEGEEKKEGIVSCLSLHPTFLG